MTAILQTPFPKSISEIKIFEFGFNLQVCFWWSNDHAVSNRSGGALQWRHNEIDCVSNHQHLDRLFNRLLSAHQRKHQSSALPGYWPLWRESAGDRYVDSPHKGPVTRTMFPFDDVTMWHDPKQAMSHYTTQFSVAYSRPRTWSWRGFP